MKNRPNEKAPKRPAGEPEAYTMKQEASCSPEFSKGCVFSGGAE